MGEQSDPGGQKMLIDDDPNWYLNQHKIEYQLDEAAKNGATKFVIVFKPMTEKLPSSNPKTIKESIKNKVSDVRKVKEMIYARNGNLLAITENLQTAKELGATMAITGKPVKPRIQTESITMRFLVFKVTIDTSLEELKDELEEENDIRVHSLRRFTRKTDKGMAQTETVLVTVYGRILPEHVYLWCQRQRVSLFIDRPRQCAKCWSYNHPSRFCKKEQTCSNCSLTHDPELNKGETCKAVTRCTLCGEAHKADSKECKLYIKEVEIQHFKAINGLTITEARRLLNNQAKTYATKVISGSHQTTKKEIKEATESSNKDLIEAFQKILKEQERHFTSLLIAVTEKFEKALKETEENTKQIITEILDSSNRKEQKESASPASKKQRKNNQEKNEPAIRSEKSLQKIQLEEELFGEKMRLNLLKNKEVKKTTGNKPPDSTGANPQ